ncbi:MAG TPA: hypothetical protein PKV75_05260 [Desulfobacterales bacterium]|nr:hypothetical protein [Desulfobacterales bacterium]
MVWVVEKKVFHHLLNLGFSRIEIPVRVKFEFEVKEGNFVHDSISFQILYNRSALEKYYPKLKSKSLEKAMEKTVKKEIRSYLKACGYIKKEDHLGF